MLSFSIGKPIAIVRGGMFHGKYLRVYDPQLYPDVPNEEMWSDPMDMLSDWGFFDNLKTQPKKNFEGLRKALITATKQPLDPEIKDLYEAATEVLNNMSRKIFSLMDGELELMPNPDKHKREQLWIASPTGSGKTFFALKFMAKYQHMFGREVFIVTKNMRDQTIKHFVTLPQDDPDFVDPNVINWSERVRLPGTNRTQYKLVVDPLQMSEFKNSALLWDDIEYMPDKDLEEALEKARDDSMGVGRHDNITVLNTGHLLTNYKKTRKILSEADYVVVYPQGGTSRGLDYFLKDYLGSDSKITNKRIKDLKSRWVCFHCKYPKFVLHAHGCFMI